MKASALEKFMCSNCGNVGFSASGLASKVLGDGITEGLIKCKTCSASHPVKNGIPRFVPEENYAGSFGYQWNIHSKTQLDSYTKLPISRNRLFQVSGWPQRMEDQVVLEAGSGAGRFTEVLLGTGAIVYSFDYSSAVDANQANNGHSPNLNLFQGDIFRIPLPKAGFDKVMCIGVIQHTPDPEKAFHSLAEQVRPGGDLVIDAYPSRFLALLQWKYLLRPLTKRMNQETLYKIISLAVPILLPLTMLLRRVGGRAGARMMPIVEYSSLGLPYELNKQFSILDTFDMYSPAHDHPQSISTIKRWFEEAGFTNVSVGYGPNGVVGKGTRPARFRQAGEELAAI